MTILEELYQEAFDKGVDVFYVYVCASKKSMCLLEGGYTGVAINKEAIESSVEEMILLAEEIAHLENGLLYHIQRDFNSSA